MGCSGSPLLRRVGAPAPGPTSLTRIVRLLAKRIQEPPNSMVNRNLLRQYDLPDEDIDRNSMPSFARTTTGSPTNRKTSRSTRSSPAGSSTSSATRSSSTSATRAKASSSSTSGTTRAPTRSSRPRSATSVEVLLEAVEDETGEIVLSLPQGEAAEGMGSDHRQAQGRRRRLRQGHPQDQGRPAGRHRRQRLPARQPGRHPPAAATSPTTSASTIECMILKIDEARRNIVVCRRKLIEDQPRRR